MQQNLAMVEIRRLLGPEALLRFNSAASVDGLEDELATAALARDQARAALEERAAQVLNADPRWRSCMAALRVRERRLQTLTRDATQPRIVAGRRTFSGFQVEAVGNNWDEVLGKLKARNGRPPLLS